MPRTLTLRQQLPSNSHNAPYSPDVGPHWPAGQRFKLPGRREQTRLRRYYMVRESATVVQQIGGEEVYVALPTARFSELFGVELA